MPDDKIKLLIDEILDRRVLKRAVFSKIQDKNILRITAAPVEMPDGSVALVFPTPVRAPAPGQSAVLYRAGCVEGGGFIDSILP